MVGHIAKLVKEIEKLPDVPFARDVPVSGEEKLLNGKEQSDKSCLETKSVFF